MAFLVAFKVALHGCLVGTLIARVDRFARVKCFVCAPLNFALCHKVALWALVGSFARVACTHVTCNLGLMRIGIAAELAAIEAIDSIYLWQRPLAEKAGHSVSAQLLKTTLQASVPNSTGSGCYCLPFYLWH